MNERRHFIDAHQRGELGIAELCRRFGISRKTGYKWLERFYADGADEEEALRDRSRRPHSHPRSVPTWLEEAIVHARQQRPHWGPKKLRAVLVHRNPRGRASSAQHVRQDLSTTGSSRSAGCAATR